MRLVSFSLYGSDKKYIEGALINAEFISNNMTDWTPVFYLGPDIDSSISRKLISLGAIVRQFQDNWHPNGMFWRFNVFCDFHPDYAIIRDTDSRITDREIEAIDEWVASGKMFHILRDHPFHNVRILGGMWGATSELSSLLTADKFLRKYGVSRGQDQLFLSEYLYPFTRGKSLIHDSFFWINVKRQKFSKQRVEGQYVGESVGADGEVDMMLRSLVVEYENSLYLRIQLNVKYLKEKSTFLRYLNHLRHRSRK